MNTNLTRDELKALIREVLVEMFSEMGKGSASSAKAKRERSAPADLPRTGGRPPGKITESAAAHLQTKPEWVRPGDCRRLFGISRATVYHWIRDGLIESKLIRQRGKLTGIRLVSYDSLDKYLKGREDAR